MNPPNRTTRMPDLGKGLVTIVIPAKDEEEAIATTLRALPISTLRTAGYATEVIVLDGRSLDGTARIAKQWGAKVIRDRGNGKGAALREARPEFKGRFVVMLDADGTYAPDAIPHVIDQLERNVADVVMGVRAVQAGAMSGTHRAGNAMLSLGASTLYGSVCRDLCTGLWGFTKPALDVLPLTSRGFELEAELFALSRRLDLRVGHVKVDYLPRKGVSKLGTRDGLKIAWCLLRSRFIALPGASPDNPPTPSPFAAPLNEPNGLPNAPAVPTHRPTGNPVAPLPTPTKPTTFGQVQP